MNEKITRKDKALSSRRKVERNKARLAKNAQEMVAKIELLRKHFPEENKFSRQNIYQFTEDGETQQIELPASVLLDPDKPHGFVMLGHLLGQGSYGRVKQSWWYDKEKHLHAEDIEKIAKEYSDCDVLYEECRALKRIGQNSRVIDREDVVKSYLNQKKARGAPLSAWIKQKRVLNKLSTIVLLDIAIALHQDFTKFSERGMVHGDLSSHNVMLDFTPEKKPIVTLIDFASARPEGHSIKDPMGTVEIACPLTNKFNYKADKRVDIYAEAGLFGLILGKQLNRLRYDVSISSDKRRAFQREKNRLCGLVSVGIAYKEAARVPYRIDNLAFRSTVDKKIMPAVRVLLKAMTDEDDVISMDSISCTLKILREYVSIRGDKSLSQDAKIIEFSGLNDYLKENLVCEEHGLRAVLTELCEDALSQLITKKQNHLSTKQHALRLSIAATFSTFAGMVKNIKNGLYLAFSQRFFKQRVDARVIEGHAAPFTQRSSAQGEISRPALPPGAGIDSSATMFSKSDSSQERFQSSNQSWRLLKNKVGPTSE